MDKYITIFVILLLNISIGSAQGFAWGPKGGLSLGQQNVEGYQRDILFASHGALYIESLTEENKNALYAQLGYHVRGSTIRIPRYTSPINGQNISASSQDSKYSNIALQLGGKQKFDLGLWSKWYFNFGIRGEYNLSIELPNIYSDNLKDRVNKVLYGVSAGIGAELMFSELAGAVVEFSIHPDLSDQLLIPAQPSISNPNRLIPEKRVRNVSYELTLGFRFLRKVIYEE